MAIFAQPSALFLSVLQNAPTGLAGTAGVRVTDPTGGVAVARATAGIVEAPAGSGCYLAQIVAPATPGVYLPEWDTGSVSPSTFASDDRLVVSWSVGPHGEATDAAVSSLLAAGGVVELEGPVSQQGDVMLIAGDDYTVSDGRPLVFNDPAGDWPDLTAATVAFDLRAGQATAVLFTAAGAVVIPSGTSKQVRVELTHAQTATIRPGVYRYQVAATLTGGAVVTLADGQATVEAS